MKITHTELIKMGFDFDGEFFRFEIAPDKGVELMSLFPEDAVRVFIYNQGKDYEPRETLDEITQAMLEVL